MTKFRVICQYCGEERNEWLYSDTVIENLKCYVCNDKNLKFKKYEESNGDSYGYHSDKPKPDAYIKKY